MKNSKQIKRLLFLFCTSVFLISCSSVSKFSTAKTIDITPTIIQKPTVADMQVNETKVTGTFTGKIKTTPLETIKSEAVASALKSVNADILVEPRFDTTINGSQTTVTVSGFPATFKNFRAMKEEDIPLMKIGTVRQVHTFTPPTVVAKKSNSGKILLITLGVAALVVGATSGGWDNIKLRLG